MRLETRRVSSTEISGNVVSGYAVRFDEPSLPLPGPNGTFIETIDAGAFDRSLASERSVSMFWNHDVTSLPLATTRGRLDIDADSSGVKFRAEFAPTTAALDIRALLESGDIDGAMSFGFIVREDEWSSPRDSKHQTRRVLAADLLEISLVDVGAYPHARANIVQPRRKRAARILEILK